MKLAIFQFLIGPPKGQQHCIKTVNSYCQKFGIDHYLSQEIRVHGPHVMFEKYQLFNLLDNGYDRVLYLDADIMITPSAKNIFEIYSDNKGIIAYDENYPNEAMDRDNYIYENSSNIAWPKNKYNKKRYFNAGVMIFSKEIIKKYPSAFNLDDIPNWPDIWYFGDQTIVNYWVTKNQIPFNELDYQFNRMHLGVEDPNNCRYQANFIHYAGPCTYGNGNKPETMEKDYNILYNKNTSL